MLALLTVTVSLIRRAIAVTYVYKQLFTQPLCLTLCGMSYGHRCKIHVTYRYRRKINFTELKYA